MIFDQLKIGNFGRPGHLNEKDIDLTITPLAVFKEQPAPAHGVKRQNWHCGYLCFQIYLLQYTSCIFIVSKTKKSIS